MNTVKKELISVVIPTYNRAPFLEKTLRSVLSQTVFEQDRTDFEILVCDDGSTDETSTMIDRFNDSRIRHLRLAHSGLPAVARNAGIRQAKGDFVAFLDSDDLWMPSKLEKQLELFRKNPDAGLIYSEVVRFSESADKTEEFGPIPYNLRKNGHIYRHLLFFAFVANSSVVVPRAIFEEVGFLDESVEFRAVEDYEFWLRVSARRPAYCVPEPLVRYRFHPGNISSNRMIEITKTHEVIRKSLAENPQPQFIASAALMKTHLRRLKEYSKRLTKSLKMTKA